MPYRVSTAMNSIRQLIRSIISEGPLDYWGSVAPPTGPKTQGHVLDKDIPELRSLFKRMGHTYSIQVATNPQRSLEALKPLKRKKILAPLDRKSGTWIIRAPDLEALSEYSPLSNLVRNYNPENIHILSLRPSQSSDLYGPRWTLHDLIGHPLEKYLVKAKRSLERDGSPLNRFVRKWIVDNSEEGLMVDLDLLPELAALLLTEQIPPGPEDVVALLQELKAGLLEVLDSWRGAIIVVGPI